MCKCCPKMYRLVERDRFSVRVTTVPQIASPHPTNGANATLQRAALNNAATSTFADDGSFRYYFTKDPDQTGIYVPEVRAAAGLQSSGMYFWYNPGVNPSQHTGGFPPANNTFEVDVSTRVVTVWLWVGGIYGDIFPPTAAKWWCKVRYEGTVDLAAFYTVGLTLPRVEIVYVPDTANFTSTGPPLGPPGIAWLLTPSDLAVRPEDLP